VRSAAGGGRERLRWSERSISEEEQGVNGRDTPSR
jgi:hypothetical protein